MAKSAPLTRTIAAATARTQFGQILELVQEKRARFVVSRNGQPVAAIITIEDYLERVLEKPEALVAIQAASRERGLDLLSVSQINEEVVSYRAGKRRKRR